MSHLNMIWQWEDLWKGMFTIGPYDSEIMSHGEWFAHHTADIYSYMSTHMHVCAYMHMFVHNWRRHSTVNLISAGRLVEHNVHSHCDVRKYYNQKRNHIDQKWVKPTWDKRMSSHDEKCSEMLATQRTWQCNHAGSTHDWSQPSIMEHKCKTTK